MNAGTAISTRGRGQANSFNVIRVDGRERASVTQWAWADSAFVKLEAAEFLRGDDGWPDEEDAEATQRTQKNIPSRFLLRPLRTLCVLCVRLSGFSAH